jgi:methylated-DNA-protein-cysteine methyltransferase-like protein
MAFPTRRSPKRMKPRDILRLGEFDSPVDKEARELRFREVILSIPRGRVASYGQVAAAAGYPMYHRQVAKLLRNCGDGLPWHRVLGAGGFIKTHQGLALEQRLRLETEGVRFLGQHVDFAAHQHIFRTWEF